MLAGVKDRKSTRLNSSHVATSHPVVCPVVTCFPTRRSSDLRLFPAWPPACALRDPPDLAPKRFGEPRTSRNLGNPQLTGTPEHSQHQPLRDLRRQPVVHARRRQRSEEHTSELQSRGHLASRRLPCRYLLPYTTFFRSPSFPCLAPGLRLEGPAGFGSETIR